VIVKEQVFFEPIQRQQMLLVILRGDIDIVVQNFGGSPNLSGAITQKKFSNPVGPI
jgi:hypothetical protein